MFLNRILNTVKKKLKSGDVKVSVSHIDGNPDKHEVKLLVTGQDFRVRLENEGIDKTKHKVTVIINGDEIELKE